jgi:hypothetical protein
MKRTALFLMLALCVLSLVSAQGRDRRGQAWRQGSRHGHHNDYRGQGRHHRQGSQRPDTRNQPRPQIENVNVSGSLTLSRGMIAVEKDGITYLTFGLERFIGFIDGLKEGAQVTLEGIATVNPQNNSVKMLRVRKMTLNGKEYDLAGSFRNPASPTPQPRQRPNR